MKCLKNLPLCKIFHYGHHLPIWVTQPLVPDNSWNWFMQGNGFSSSRSVNSEDGFHFKLFAGNGRKRCLRCSDCSTNGEVEMMQRIAVAVSA